MEKINETVRRETMYIAGVVLIGSMLMEAVFLIIGQWNYTVLLGNLLGGGAAILNFFLMGLTVQKAVQKEEKHAAVTMRFSQTMRMLLLFIAALFGAVLPCFQLWATLIPLLFPVIGIYARGLFGKKGKEKPAGNENENQNQ